MLFISSLEHEVLPAWRPRFALTTWMFNRRDTALEAWAEEMREKKASGKLNTKAILAAIEADSSSSSEGEGSGSEGEAACRRGSAARSRLPRSAARSAQRCGGRGKVAHSA